MKGPRTFGALQRIAEGHKVFGGFTAKLHGVQKSSSHNLFIRFAGTLSVNLAAGFEMDWVKLHRI